MELLSLPYEVLEAIFSLLSPQSIISVSSTCKLFHQLAQSDQVWIAAIYRKFGFKIYSSKGFAQRFYKNVLYKYGDYLGLWIVHADCYGGLLQIKYSDGRLCALELQLPKNPHITNSLRPRKILEIKLDEFDSVKTTCCINPLQSHHHPCTLSYGEKALTPSSPCLMYLTRQCEVGVNSIEHQENPDFTIELERWLAEQSDFNGEEAGYTRRQMIYKYMVLRQIDLKTHYSRFVLPEKCNFCVPLQPGLFKGTYSSHGLELIMLTYEDDVNKVKAVKITGDPNIPAGQITFRADLPYCMHLTEREQASLEDIELIQPASSDVEWNYLPTSQPFVVPRGCVERYPGIPDSCKARFHGFGQVAAEGFQNASFIEGHWIVFNEHLFGFLWISLQSLSMYHRVQEQLTN